MRPESSPSSVRSAGGQSEVNGGVEAGSRGTPKTGTYGYYLFISLATFFFFLWPAFFFVYLFCCLTVVFFPSICPAQGVAGE